MLDGSGAERDEDGSIIALRSVSRDGPSRAYLGGRSVPAKSLSGFTAELLTLHGQNDQLRLMRPDEQRGALDRFAGVDARLEKYRKLRDAWQTARRDYVDRSNRARELAQEADRLKFALQRDRHRRSRTRRRRSARQRYPPALGVGRATRGRIRRARRVGRRGG